jgi:hypothetical protein
MINFYALYVFSAYCLCKTWSKTSAAEATAPICCRFGLILGRNLLKIKFNKGTLSRGPKTWTDRRVF